MSGFRHTALAVLRSYITVALRGRATAAIDVRSHVGKEVRTGLVILTASFRSLTHLRHELVWISAAHIRGRKLRVDPDCLAEVSNRAVVFAFAQHTRLPSGNSSWPHRPAACPQHCLRGTTPK